MKQFKKQKKGVALLWVLTLIFVLLIIAGSLSSLISKELRLSTNIDMSEQAYAAARSGIDVGIKIDVCVSGNKVSNPITGVLNMGFGVGYKVYCDTDNLTIISEGEAGVAVNKIVRKIKRTRSTATNFGTVLGLPENAGSISNDLRSFVPGGNIPIFGDTGNMTLRNGLPATVVNPWDASTKSSFVGWKGVDIIDSNPSNIQFTLNTANLSEVSGIHLIYYGNGFQYPAGTNYQIFRPDDGTITIEYSSDGINYNNFSGTVNKSTSDITDLCKEGTSNRCKDLKIEFGDSKNPQKLTGKSFRVTFSEYSGSRSDMWLILGEMKLENAGAYYSVESYNFSKQPTTQLVADSLIDVKQISYFKDNTGAIPSQTNGDFIQQFDVTKPQVSDPAGRFGGELWSYAGTANILQETNLGQTYNAPKGYFFVGVSSGGKIKYIYSSDGSSAQTGDITSSVSSNYLRIRINYEKSLGRFKVWVIDANNATSASCQTENVIVSASNYAFNYFGTYSYASIASSGVDQLGIKISDSINYEYAGKTYTATSESYLKNILIKY